MRFEECDNCGRATTTTSAWSRRDTDVVVCGRANCRDARRRAKEQWQRGDDVRL